MVERLAHASIELVAWVWAQDGVTAFQARQHARLIGERDALNDDETQRLLRVADALVGPVVAEDA